MKEGVIVDIYNALLVFFFGISIAVIYYLGKRLIVPGTKCIILWFVLISFWLACQRIYDSNVSESVKLLLFFLRFIPISFIPLTLLFFVKAITGNVSFLNKRNIITLSIIPVITNIMVWTNTFHHLFLSNYKLLTVNESVLIQPFYGPYYWLHIVYSYVILIYSVITLNNAMHKASLRHKRQYFTLILATIVPLAVNFLANFAGGSFKYIDYTPIFVLFSALICLVNLFVFKLIEFVPLTRASIIENMEDVFIAFDQESRVIDFNKSAKILFGFISDYKLGQTMDDVFHDWPEFLAILKTMIHDQENGTVKINQNNQYFNVTITQLFDVNNKLSSIYLVMRCTSEFEDVIFRYHNETVKRIQAEEKSKYLLQALEYNPVCFILTDSQGNIQYVNKSFTEITGYTFEEVMNQNPRILNARMQTDEYYKELWDTITKGQVWQGEFCNKKKNGELYWEKAIISPFYSKDGTLSNFIGIKIDITRTKKMEEELTYSEEFLNIIFNNIPSMIFVKDLQDFRYVKVNKTCANFVSETQEQMLEKTDYDIFPLNLAKILNDSDKRAIEIGFTDEIELHSDNKDDSQKYIHSRKVLVNGLDGRPAYILGIADDITPKTLLEKELITAKEAAEAANLAKSEFIANISHEIRTPMNAILGMLQLTLQTELTNQQREYIDIVHTSSKSLMNIINEILDYAKIESGKASIENIEFNINKIISHVIKLNKIYAQQKGLQLSYEISPDVPRLLMGDPNRLSQVLTNLVANAIKFTEIGYVYVTVKKTVMDDGKEVILFTIKDTGVGIKAEAVNNLFHPFIQADMSITRKYGGTGLGLTISKHFIECMGGKIWIKSIYGKGSEFTFYIPYTVNANEHEKRDYEKRNDPALQYRFDGFHVLVAEDNVINQMVVREILSKTGIKIDIAENGESAIAMLEKNKYDLVFMDIQMPVMDGYETVMHIRKDPRYDDLPIIAMTAHNMSGDRNKAISLGMNDYVTKPFEIDVLYKILNEWINS